MKHMCMAHYIAKVVAEEEKKETQAIPIKHKQTNTK